MSEGAHATGRVYDLGFRRYEGPREGRRRAVLAVYKDGLRTSLGLGRGGRAKVVPWLFIAASLMPAVVMALVAGAVNRLAPDFDPTKDLPSLSDYYALSSIVLLIFAAVIGAGALLRPTAATVCDQPVSRSSAEGDRLRVARWSALLTVMRRGRLAAADSSC